ncbi:MAG TPA: acyltransferase [Acidiferrobacteraceae bacterium]|nr:acyltransferase [Acidiferrobacteraceae bacterium]
MILEKFLSIPRRLLEEGERRLIKQDIGLQSRVGRLRNTDHAFVSGGVFPCPGSLEEAVRLTRDELEAKLLVDVWRQFSSNGVIGESVLLGLNARMLNDNPDRNRVTVGESTVLRGLIRQESQGVINIGSHVYLGDCSLIHATREVSIGDDTLIAHNVNIIDNDAHPVDAKERVSHFRHLLGLEAEIPYEIASAPVRIGARCWLGLNSVILKGVEIGDETIVGAGSVVSKSLPPGVLAAGNPAVPVKQL